MSTFITVIHVVVSLFLMLTVLLQSGKGGMGAAFGGGGNTGTVFGGSGAGGMLRKATGFAAATFMLTSMTLAYVASRTGEDALRKFSAAEEQNRKLREDARMKALGADPNAPDLPEGTAPEGAEGTAPEGTAPEGAAPEGTEGTAPEGTGTDTTEAPQPIEGADVPPAGEPPPEPRPEPTPDE
ncbi:MAG TPA: preprotein translocase subunit SecG [Kofleriaceae bacterium]|nr:preprotein translocase subunit SecG [Kofleriaceae bacterium]